MRSADESGRSVPVRYEPFDMGFLRSMCTACSLTGAGSMSGAWGASGLRVFLAVETVDDLYKRGEITVTSEALEHCTATSTRERTRKRNLIMQRSSVQNASIFSTNELARPLTLLNSLATLSCLRSCGGYVIGKQFP
jgi:hypothetical protein